MKLVHFFSIFFFLIFNCQAADNIATLQALYPDQSKSFLKTRIENSNNLHKFYRSFVRYYYSVLKKNPDYISTLSSLKNFSGPVSGDPHVENFGFLVDKNHRAHFSFNDFDDADNSVLSLDLLRHLVSTLMIKPDIKLELYFKHYLRGLDGTQEDFPDELIDMKKKAEKKGHRLSEDEVNIEDKEFLKYKQVVIKMTDSENQVLTAKLEKLLQKEIDPTLKINELYKRTKDSGGSAGLIRYQLLITVKNRLLWLEMKEFTKPATSYYYTKSKKVKSERLQLIKDNLLPMAVRDEFGLITFEGKSYMTCYIWDGEKGVDFQGIEESIWDEIILLEVQFIGYLHGKSINKQTLNSYRDASSKLPVENWKFAAKKIMEKMNETYKNVKN